MESTQKKTSVPVCEMAAMLGIKKTDSYWLIKKHLFDVIGISLKCKQRAIRSEKNSRFSAESRLQGFARKPLYCLVCSV